MIHDYRAPDESYHHFILWIIYSFLIGWTFYSWGYNDAKTDYAQTIKYRCIDGTVYRSASGYLEKTSQNCIPMENTK